MCMTKMHHTRAFFQNIKGLTSSTSCEDFKYSLDRVHALQVDFSGLIETNLPWTQASHIQSDFRQCLRRQFTVGKVVFGSPTSSVDRVQPKDVFQS